MLNIGVFCSSLDGEKIFSEKTKELGAFMAKEKLFSGLWRWKTWPNG